jgi:hypothetical protein
MILVNENDGYGKLVHEHISAYLCKDVSHYIANEKVLIYGGAVRDALAGDEIRDVDIVGDSASCMSIQFKLMRDGWEKNRSFGVAKDIAMMSESERQYQEQYNLFALTEWHLNGRQVQLMTPKEEFYKAVHLRTDEVELCTVMFASNVDLSNCAVGYNLHNGFISFAPCAVHDCLNRRFKVMSKAHLKHEKNIKERIKKFVDRGWLHYEDDSDGK